MMIFTITFLQFLPLVLTNGFVHTPTRTKITRSPVAAEESRSISTTNSNKQGQRRRFPFLFRAASVEIEEVKTTETSESITTSSSWEDLAKRLNDGEESPTKPTSLVTLYRDTNGWCPFCERIWLLLRAKNIPYEEQVISLQKKPDWYKALVPTTLVPAVLFHEDISNNITERRIVWESIDIMKALDESFPSTPRMVLDDDENYNDAVAMNDRLIKAGFEYVYAGSRNSTMTEDEKKERKQNFMNALDELDDALGKVVRENDEDFFRLGSKFTGIDAIMIPTLERWRYQLPLTRDVDILEGRGNILRWFQTMESFEPYRSRVGGDAYSWTATNSMFLRYFGGGEDKPEIQDAIKRTDISANQLTQSFSSMDDGTFGPSSLSEFDAAAIEAATKLITNHDAVLRDCIDENEPISQKDIIRASSDNKSDIDFALRFVASALLDLSSDDQKGEDIVDVASTFISKREEELMTNIQNKKNVSLAMRTVAARTCVPRDMSAPAAIVFRGILSIIADRLDIE